MKWTAKGNIVSLKIEQKVKFDHDFDDNEDFNYYLYKKDKFQNEKEIKNGNYNKA